MKIFGSRKSKKEASAAKHEDDSSRKEPIQYWLPSLEYRFSEIVKKMGFENGLLRLDKVIFEKYIEAYEENKRLGLLISRLEKEAEEKEKEFLKTTQDRADWMATVIRKKQEHDHQLEEKRRFERLLQYWKEQYQKAMNIFSENRPAYGWVGTLLLVAAGVIFILTDISIIKVVAYAVLDMGGNEPLIFAIGIGFLTIVMKPLVDRVFEKPYLQGNRLYMHGLLIFVSLLTILALGLMGNFRYDDLLHSLIGDDSIGSYYGKGYVAWMFILTSILFAIAGAICFSIGMPVFRQHTNFMANRISIQFKKRYCQNKINRANQKWREAENDWKIAEQKLLLLPNSFILEAELKRLKLDIEIARAAQHQAHTEAVLAIYRDSFQRGERFVPSEEELHKLGLVIPIEQNPYKYLLDRKSSGSNLFNSQYLHEYIRRKIHDKNKLNGVDKH